MQQGEVVNLTQPLALNAARIPRELALPMADSIMLASAVSREATLWTQDADFEAISGVKYIAKPK